MTTLVGHRGWRASGVKRLQGEAESLKLQARREDLNVWLIKKASECKNELRSTSIAIPFNLCTKAIVKCHNTLHPILLERQCKDVLPRCALNRQAGDAFEAETLVEAGITDEHTALCTHQLQQRDGESVRIPQRSNDKLLCAVAIGVILKSCSASI